MPSAYFAAPCADCSRSLTLPCTMHQLRCTLRIALPQVSGWQGAQALHADQGAAVAYRGMVDCFVRTVREEGMQVRRGGGGG